MNTTPNATTSKQILRLRWAVRIIRWGGLFVAVWIAFMLVLSAFSESLPPSLAWLSRSKWGFAFVLSLIITTTTFSWLEWRNQHLSSRKIGAVVTMIASVVATILFALWILSLILNERPSEVPLPPDATTAAIQQQSELSTLIAPFPLTDKQRNDIEEILKEKDFITHDDLINALTEIGLSELQAQQIETMLEQHGYITKDDALDLIHQESTAVATAQTATAVINNVTATAAAAYATASAPKCYITPISGISNVNFLHH